MRSKECLECRKKAGNMWKRWHSWLVWLTKSSSVLTGILVLNPVKKDMKRTSTKFWLVQCGKNQSLSTAYPPKQIHGNSTHSVQHICSSQKLCRRVSASEYQQNVSLLWMKSSLKVKGQHYYIWQELIHIEWFLVWFLQFSCVTLTLLFLHTYFN